ncbi:uncharacterized protein LOC115227688 [Octopus sinensis]|uniref:Uncharacterized protein LOC115227688 n=1 Tax=Octopus sinensis TaxID=2607531 RepID=A0A6P7TWJ3_9MOLL|nr:uncharacterized protein LOC115227688 [Octopus sinensis]
MFFITELLNSKLCLDKDIQLNIYMEEFQEEIYDELKSIQDVGFHCLRSVNFFSILPNSLIGSDLVLFIKNYKQNDVSLVKYYSECCKNKCKISTKYVFCGFSGDMNYLAQEFYSENKSIFPNCNVVTITGNIDLTVKKYISDKVCVNVSDVVDLVVWGNTNNLFHISYEFVKVLNSNGAIQKSSNDYYRPLKEILDDQKVSH